MLRLEHVAKRYDDGAVVLADISLSLEAGEFCVLTGGSGAGKTTLLRLIHLAERPSGGTLALFGADPAGLDRRARARLRRRIGIVFQEPRLFDRLSARDNVALPLRIAGAAETRVRDDVAELLAWVGLEARNDAPAERLSAGERQRVAIARAIVHRPELLVVDEPAAAVDEETGAVLAHLFESLHRLGTTVLVATRDLGSAPHFRHRRIHLEEGVVSEAAAAAAQ